MVTNVCAKFNYNRLRIDKVLGNWKFDANNVWYPKRKTDVDIERVQKRATKLIPGLSNKSYIERLKVLGLNLPTLKYRRYRGDMIEPKNL